VTGVVGAGVDEEHRARRDPPDEVLEVLRGQPVLEDRVREVAHAVAQRGADLVQAIGVVDLLGHRARPGALGDDRRQVVRLRGGLEHHLAAHGEPEPRDPPRVDVGAVPEEVDARADVLVEVPAEGVGVALAAALAAAVVEQHAVAVADEHPRLPARARASGEDDDRRAVARRDVPAVEVQPVGGVQRDVLVGGAQIGRRDLGARHVRADRGHAERQRRDGQADDDAGALGQAPRVAAGRVVVQAARRPEARGRRGRGGSGAAASDSRPV
jgi:hypothetical protein